MSAAAGGSERPRWRLADLPGTRLRWLDGEAVLFNPVSWETHLFNESASLILATLLEAPQGAWEIAEALSQEGIRLDPEAGPLEAEVESLLAQLEDLGLICSDGAAPQP
jgi:PqqD family protein of HPr-rel-A system